MSAEDLAGEQRRRQRAAHWRPQGAMTSGLRGVEPGKPPVVRWEEMLRAERSVSYLLGKLAARVPALRGVLGLSANFAADEDPSLEAREARADEVRRSLVGRLAKRRDANWDGSSAVPADWRPGGWPTIGPALDHEIDKAIELLRSLPFEELQWRGWHFQPNHYYWPLNDVPFLREHPEVWIRSEVPAGIEWDFEGQLELLRQVAPYAAAELGDVADGPPRDAGEFVWDNGAFPRGDACAYYGIVRHLRPQRVIEVGAGWSTLMLERALAANARPTEVTVVEPDPAWHVLGELPREWNVVKSPVQLADLSRFEALAAGDVLFYDGSHCVRTGSDVNWIFFEVLPRLAPGVWVHVHDLGWPMDYSLPWVLDEGLSWNEQYLVQAFLVGNSNYRVRLAVSMLWQLRRSEVEARMGGKLPGGSLWLEKLA